MKQTYLTAVLGLLCLATIAQRPIESSADIFQEIKKLNVLTNVLYIAAHPDDENTRLIAWLENEKLARTAYLSLTRGDGGQNLVGSEKGDAMGVLRTQELLEARKTDGGEQFFSRAVDFGYSKTAEETLEIWDKKLVLSDVVWTIRKFRPDVIVTRFPPDERAGHGHHTASAMLAEEAFKLAADKTAYPEQLNFVDTWQPKRILWNTSVWWDNQLPEKAAKSEDYIKINIGDYNELLGLSYSEIAADSRSQHKSQGFGSSRSRGNKLEYLKHTDGEKAESDLFEGVDTDWSRVENSKDIQDKLNTIIANYDFQNPAQSVKGLTQLYTLFEGKKDNFFVAQKMEELRRIILAASGIVVEALADDYAYPAFEQIDVSGKFVLINRNEIKATLTAIKPAVDSTFEAIQLEKNEELELPFSQRMSVGFSQPYWLTQNFETYIDEVPALRGMPENLKLVDFNYTLEIEGVPITFSVPIDYKWTDRVDGELHRDVVVKPGFTVSPSEKVYIFSNDEPQVITALVESNKPKTDAVITVSTPEGWKVRPPSITVNMDKIGAQQMISFKLIPPNKPSDGHISFVENIRELKAVQNIDYPHVKPQILFPASKSKLVKMDLKKTVTKVGYIIGSGDEVAQNLNQVGFKVTSFKAEDLPSMDLSEFETIMVGIRAFNTEESMKNGNDILNEFVNKGGNVIVQYNTNRGLVTDEIGPYPFKISRNRVTKEEAEPTFLKPEHPLLNTPNKLSKSDFDNWVQERGLYFADEWDEKYEPIIAWNDPGEEPQKGSILVADYGKGHFMYTGVSFFRQLPAGVPGAYRLLTNMISYGK